MVLDLDELLVVVLERGGSDLHITAGIPPVMRRNGALVRLEGPSLTPDDTRGLLSGAMTEIQHEMLDHDREHDFAYSVPGRAQFRVNAYYQRGSMSAASRLIPKEIRTFHELGLPLILEDLSLKPRGLILVTGPTGSGKSTTLAAMVEYVNQHREAHAVTLEDHIEYLHEHKKSMVTQREVGSDTHSFGRALRHVLRQDPDVILVGEMRDLETMRAALTAAETGHLVLTTLHTQEATQAIDRIIDVFPPHQQQQVRIQLAMTLQGILSQQLLPSVGDGGRVVATEVLAMTSAVRNLIREGKTYQLQTAMETGSAQGMKTMDRALVDLYRRGVISLDTALQKALDRNAVRDLIGET